MLPPLTSNEFSKLATEARMINVDRSTMFAKKLEYYSELDTLVTSLFIIVPSFLVHLGTMVFKPTTSSRSISYALVLEVVGCAYLLAIKLVH